MEDTKRCGKVIKDELLGRGGDEGVEEMQGVRVEDREEVIFSERLNICLCLKVVTR